jgi:hypothetical protein
MSVASTCSSFFDAFNWVLCVDFFWFSALIAIQTDLDVDISLRSLCTLFLGRLQIARR